jgi:DNA-binding transcriptional MerR regulator
MRYTIGQLAKMMGCKPQTIRYYEEIGVLPPAERTEGNQRRFGENHRQRLAFVRHSRELGFSLDSITELLDLADDPDAPCEQADRIAKANLVEIESRINRLEALKIEMQRMVSQCRGGTAADCRVLEVLADHDLCFSGHEHELAVSRLPKS